jgi:hypothetical protein
VGGELPPTRAFFEALLCENMDLGPPGERRAAVPPRPGRPAALPAGGGFRTTIDRYCHMVTNNGFCKNSRASST